MKEKLKIAEEKYLALGLLKFDNTVEVDNTVDLAVFLNALIYTYNRKCNTLNLQDAITDQADRHRSTQDIFRIAKYYYPDTNLEEILTILFDLHKEENIYSLWCADIKKVTFFPKEGRGYGNEDYRHIMYSKIDGISEISTQEYYDYFIKNK